MLPNSLHSHEPLSECMIVQAPPKKPSECHLPATCFDTYSRANCEKQNPTISPQLQPCCKTAQYNPKCAPSSYPLLMVLDVFSLMRPAHDDLHEPTPQDTPSACLWSHYTTDHLNVMYLRHPPHLFPRSLREDKIRPF